jgi:predicted cobalt transporter CbtA
VRFTHLLRSGVLAGAAAGFSAALVLWLVVEPVIRRALDVEQFRPETGHAHEVLVSRGQQVVAGLVTAGIVGVLFGVVFAVVFAKTRHRLPARTEQGRAIALAAAGYAVFVLLPAVTVPANPPAVGDPATVTRRTLLYVLTILVGLLLVGLLLVADHWLRGRVSRDAVRRTVVALLATVAVVVLVAGMPAPDPIPADVPAALIWDFRLASLAQLGAMWGVLGLVFGLLVDREPSTSRQHVSV